MGFKSRTKNISFVIVKAGLFLLLDSLWSSLVKGSSWKHQARYTYLALTPIPVTFLSVLGNVHTDLTEKVETLCYMSVLNPRGYRIDLPFIGSYCIICVAKQGPSYQSSRSSRPYKRGSVWPTDAGRWS